MYPQATANLRATAGSNIPNVILVDNKVRQKSTVGNGISDRNHRPMLALLSIRAKRHVSPIEPLKDAPSLSNAHISRITLIVCKGLALLAQHRNH